MLSSNEGENIWNLAFNVDQLYTRNLSKHNYRANAHCGFLEVDGDLQIIVGGGEKENGDIWITTELFSFATNEWSFSNNLAYPIEGATTIPWK